MKKHLKLISIVLALVMVIVAFAACGGSKGGSEDASGKAADVTGANAEAGSEAAAAVTGAPITTDPEFKVGFIFLHDENSTYDKNFIDAAKAAQAALGLTDDQVKLRKNVPESSACYDAAAELADEGCDVIFADSFDHESFMIQAAQEYPDVQFYHATGTRAHTENLANFHNAFAAIYEGRYLAGVAAGMKLNEMIDSGKITAEQAKIGYVGAHPYAEVISGYTSFFLGARSICSSATMEVKYTKSWFDPALEKEAANALIQSGCVLISQHADSMGAPTACEEAGVPNVSYNGSTKSAGPNTYIISSKINWQPYFELIIKSAVNGTAVDADWTGTIATDSVQLTELNDAVAAAGTKEKLEEVKKALEDGTLHVFDTSTFTYENGKKLESYMADVNTDPNYEGDTEVVSDGYFHESEYRSAPYFNIIIDGITVPQN